MGDDIVVRPHGLQERTLGILALNGWRLPEADALIDDWRACGADDFTQPHRQA